MKDVNDYFFEWTVVDFNHHTGGRFVKSNVPLNILKKLADDEKNEFELTSRRTIINIDINTGKIIPVEEAVKEFFELKNNSKAAQQ